MASLLNQSTTGWKNSRRLAIAGPTLLLIRSASHVSAGDTTLSMTHARPSARRPARNAIRSISGIRMGSRASTRTATSSSTGSIRVSTTSRIGIRAFSRATISGARAATTRPRAPPSMDASLPTCCARGAKMGDRAFTASARTPPRIPATSATGGPMASNTGPRASTMALIAGSNAPPTVSMRLPNITCSLAIGSAAASATPPTWPSTSPRMIFCADRMSLLAIAALTCSFCASVKVTPARPRAAIPLTGSFRALPSMTDALSTDPNPAADRFRAASDAWLNTSLPSPAAFATFLKVRSMFCPVWICSSSMPVFIDRVDASSPIWAAVTFAAPPVALIVASVMAATRADSCAALAALVARPRTAPTPTAATPAFRAPPMPPRNPAPALPPAALPAPETSPSICLDRDAPKPLAEGVMDTYPVPTSTAIVGHLLTLGSSS